MRRLRHIIKDSLSTEVIVLYSTFHTTKLENVKHDLNELCRSNARPPLDELDELDELRSSTSRGTLANVLNSWYYYIRGYGINLLYLPYEH
jgi:hypothetical protein